MPNQSEKSEMLTIYDKDLNPIGERTRKEVHEKGLLLQRPGIRRRRAETIPLNRKHRIAQSA